MFCTLNKEGSLGYKLMYYDSGNTLYTVLIFHDEVFPTYPENHNTKIWEAFFINQETKAKLFLAVIKDNTNICASFFMKTGIILLHVHVNCLDTRFFFSNINWSPIFFFFFTDIKFIRTRNAFMYTTSDSLGTSTSYNLHLLSIFIQKMSSSFKKFF